MKISTVKLHGCAKPRAMQT